MTAITKLIYSWNHGNKASLDDLVAITYKKLHDSARYALGQHGSAQTLQATELVNELYCHLKSSDNAKFDNSAHFFSIAYCKLRQILQEKHRRKSAQKRDFGARVDMEEIDKIKTSSSLFESLLYSDAIEKMKSVDKDAARIVELRTFWEFSVSEILEILEMSESTYYRQWSWAKAWLRQHAEQCMPV